MLREGECPGNNRLCWWPVHADSLHEYRGCHPYKANHRHLQYKCGECSPCGGLSYRIAARLLGNPFNPLARAASSCSSQGGTLATHSDIRKANTAHGTIIPNGTRVVFRAANGDAVAYTGSSSSQTKPQCSNDFHQTSANNIKGFQYRNNSQARCDNRSRSENFTYLCKNVPTSFQ